MVKFTTSDPDLLEASPTFRVRGEEVDPAQQGFSLVHNYAHYFWRPYLGNTAFSLWELLLSFCWGENDTAFPSISRLARMLTNSDCSRAVVTGRRRAPPAATSDAVQTACEGALEVLRRERLLQVMAHGAGPTLQYTFRVCKALPLLSPEQVQRLCPGLRRDHARWLERYGIDAPAYQRAFLAPDDEAEACDQADAAAPDGTPEAARSTGADAHATGPAAGSTNHSIQSDPIQQWWQATLLELQLALLRSVYEANFRHTLPEGFEDGTLTLSTLHPGTCELLEHRFQPMLLRTLGEVSHGAVRALRFVTREARRPQRGTLGSRESPCAR